MWTSSASSCDPSLPPPPHPHYQLHTLTCHNSMSICERRLHPAVTPLSLPHPPLTCYDSTRTCEHRRCSAVTPLSLPPPPHPHYQLHTPTCYDSTRTCEHRRCSAVTPLSLPHPTPTTSFTHPPVMTAQGHVNIVSVQLRPLSPSPTPPPLPASHTHLSWQHEDMWMSSASSCDPSLPPPPHPHYQLHTPTCHDSTRTCEHRQCSAATPLSLPHPTPTTSFTHSPVMTARGHVNVVGIQLWPLSPSPTPPPLPASHTHLSWQHEDMWTSSASSCTRVALAWSTKRGWGPGLPRASWLHTPASSNVASRKCFCLQTAHRTDLGDGVLLICLIFSVFYLLLVVVLCGFWGGCLFSYMYVIPLPHLP